MWLPDLVQTSEVTILEVVLCESHIYILIWAIPNILPPQKQTNKQTKKQKPKNNTTYFQSWIIIKEEKVKKKEEELGNSAEEMWGVFVSSAEDRWIWT